jgi:hypothetical protein
MENRMNMGYDELAKRVEAMTDEEQEHFKQLIMRVAMCFGDAAMQGVFIASKEDSSTLGLFTINCTEIEAAKLMEGANDYIGFLNMRDAPPKEKFN